MEIGPLPASLGTLVLLCNPVLFMLSHSFMTDVPFMSVMNGSLLCYVRWTKRGHTHDLALGSALAVVAFLIRQLGAALALAPIGYVLLMRLVGGHASRPDVAAAPLSTDAVRRVRAHAGVDTRGTWGDP